MVRDFLTESLSHDPVHGYIPFISRSGLPAGEVAEQDVIDHPWVQRLRQIHQLQTAWWVFPSAEHMRFQHVLGAMHLASRTIEHWYDSLVESCTNVPSRAYVESLVRMTALLHDVGHGPFGHFFDDHHLDQFGITHEDIGAVIIEQELGDLLRRIPDVGRQPISGQPRLARRLRLNEFLVHLTLLASRLLEPLQHVLSVHPQKLSGARLPITVGVALRLRRRAVAHNFIDIGDKQFFEPRERLVRLRHCDGIEHKRLGEYTVLGIAPRARPVNQERFKPLRRPPTILQVFHGGLCVSDAITPSQIVDLTPVADHPIYRKFTRPEEPLPPRGRDLITRAPVERGPDGGDTPPPAGGRPSTVHVLSQAVVFKDGQLLGDYVRGQREHLL